MSSNKTGEIVKTLTLITILSTPATIIASWYGMNFEAMPELKWLHGYSFVFGLTAFTTLGTWWYVKKRKWF